MHELVHEYTLQVVQAYMIHIQYCAEMAVRNMLKTFSLEQNMKEQVCGGGDMYLYIQSVEVIGRWHFL